MARESFRWDCRIYDISGIVTDIQSGRLVPIGLDWPPEAVRAYFDSYLDPGSGSPRPPLAVDLAHAAALPVERLREPIILVHVEDRGLVAYQEADDFPHHVVADGNHRIARAAAEGVGLHALVLTRDQT